jgi:NTE family protein
MKFLPTIWRSPGRKSRPAEGVDHVRAGQTVEGGSMLLLEGQCAVQRHDTVLLPGDTIAETQPATNRTTLRALVDSTVFRLSREGFQRLLRRWSAPAFRTQPASSPEIIVPRRPRGRMACLMPLSEVIPSEEIALAIARTVETETGQPVLRLHVGGTRNESPRSLPGHPGLVFQRIADGGSSRALEALARGLDRAAEEFAHVVVELAPDASGLAFREILRHCRAVYPLLRQDGESLFELNLLVREADALGAAAPPIKPLVYLGHSENAHGLSRYIEETIKRPVHFYLREAVDGDPRLQATLRRLGREICGRQVGLALSSGAARGLSHIGVIQVLEENHIEVDVVAGSSMGAYIAAVWGAGYDGHAMEKFAREVQGYRGVWGLMDLSFYPRRGFLLTKRVRNRLEKTIGNRHFSDMARPIRVVATRLDTLERAVFSGGSVVDAVLASIAIPGICVPITLDGVPYIDGGICDPLPVETLMAMGIEKIIAVNTIATPETLRECLMETAEITRPRHPALAKVNEWVNFFAPGNAFDTMLRSIHAAQTRLAEVSAAKASLVLRPYSCAGRWHEFGNPAHFIPLGREAARAALPAIRALLDSPSHENHPPLHALAHAA